MGDEFSFAGLFNAALGQYNKDQDRDAQLQRDLSAFNENPYYGVDEAGRVYKRGVAGTIPAAATGITSTQALMIGGALLLVLLIARG